MTSRNKKMKQRRNKTMKFKGGWFGTKQTDNVILDTARRIIKLIGSNDNITKLNKLNQVYILSKDLETDSSTSAQSDTASAGATSTQNQNLETVVARPVNKYNNTTPLAEARLSSNQYNSTENILIKDITTKLDEYKNNIPTSEQFLNDFENVQTYMKKHNINESNFEKDSKYNILKYLINHNVPSSSRDDELINKPYNNIDVTDKKTYKDLIHHLRLEIIITAELNDILRKNNLDYNYIKTLYDKIKPDIDSNISNMTPSLSSKFNVIKYLVNDDDIEQIYKLIHDNEKDIYNSILEKN